MTKSDFLFTLEEKLSTLPRKDLEERLGFYREMMEDRMEDGLSEEEAVAAVGDLELIAAQILSEYPQEPKAKPSKKSRKSLPILLIILGFPLWLPLLAAAFAVVLSLYVTVWSVIASFWAVFVSLSVSAVFVSLAGILVAIFGSTAPGIAVLGAGLVCGGLSILAFHGCNLATKGTLLLTKKLLTRFMKKEAV